MSMTGELYRVPAERLRQLLAQPDLIENELYPEEETEEFEARCCSVEKTWQAIDFILEALVNNGKVEDVYPIAGGDETGAELHYGPVWYRSPQETQRISSALSPVTEDVLREGYDPKAMSDEGVYPEIWDETDGETDNFNDYIWPWFRNMVEFYSKASGLGEGVLTHIG